VLANGHYVVRFDEGGPRSEQRSPYTAACQQDMLARLVELYRRCDVVVVSDYCYGVVSDALIAQLRVLHEEQPKIILIDSKALQRFHDFPATIITPNYREALQVVSMLEGGLQGNEEAAYPAQIEYLARTLLRRMRTEHVAITLGEHGVFLLDRHEHALHLPAHPVYRAHDVGAGDSFATALALALAAGGRVEEAARIALDAAGIAVTRSRTSVVRYHELLQRVSLRAYTTGAHASVAQRGAGSQEALTALLARIAEARQAGRSLVFTNGVFDILHAGHIQFLRQAKALGDMLIVGVNSDSSAHRLKGRGRPINCEQDRVALVAALDVVDEVVLFEEDTPTELIRVLQPDIHVKGGDYADEVLPEAQAVREYGGRVVILPLAGSMSTSSVIERIVAIAAEQSAAVTHEADDRVYDYDHSQGRKA
jgi:D-beta-D-heptose 7-phosphate kinase/D-beta-D-heptose 1-phosphate adenosyltransferase